MIGEMGTCSRSGLPIGKSLTMKITSFLLFICCQLSLSPFALTGQSQTVNMVNPKQKALYDFNSQVNWLAFRPRSMDLAVALYGVRDGGKAFVCKSWADKQTKDATVDTMPSPCFCVAFSSDGSRLAWCSWTAGKQIRVAGDRGGIRAINCGKVDVTALAFDPVTTDSLACVATDGVVRIWNPTTGRPVRQLPSGGARGQCVAYSPDGRYLAASYKNNTVHLWPTAGLDRAPMTLDGHTAPVNYIAFAPNSRWLATASADTTVALWNCATGQRLHMLEQQHLDAITCLAFTPNGKYLASGDRSGKVVFWSMDTFRPIAFFFPHRRPVYSLSFSSNGEWLATGSQDRSVKFFAAQDLGYVTGRVRLAAMTEKFGINVDGAAMALDEKSSLTLAPGTHHIVVTTEDGTNSKTYAVEVTADTEKLLTIDVKSAYGKLHIVTDRPSTIVATNGASTTRGSANEPMERIVPGTYTVTVTPSDKNFAPEMRTIEIKAGETARLTTAFRLAHGDPSPPPDPDALKQVRTNPLDGAEMIWIPAGDFVMGRKNSDRDAKPPHRVSLSGYWIYRNPVTVMQYRRFCDASKGTTWEHKMPAPPRWGWNDDHPMVLVSWEDARDYGRWAFGDERRLFLPTEAQYERAMQGPEGNLYPWGDMWSAQECVNSVRPNRLGGTQPVGSHAANGFSLYDMAGNVWEWCGDWYDSDYYRRSPPHNPQGSAEGTLRTLRGGPWNESSSKLFRSDARGKAAPVNRAFNIGFRCAAGITE